MKDKLKTSEDWMKEIPEDWELTILDADGWDRSNYDYSFHEEKISKEEFMDRISFSTINANISMFDVSDSGEPF